MTTYGEGWPWPKKDPVPGTIYINYARYTDENSFLITALDADGTRRGVDLSRKEKECVLAKRRGWVLPGHSAWGDEDSETVLQSPEAWTTRPPPINPDKLAWELFRTDPEVKAFVGMVYEASRYEAVMTRAWTRDERGWARKAILRAREMLGV